MANVLHSHVKPYFNVPWAWIEGGFLRSAPPSAQKLGIFLYGYAHRHTATALQFHNAELHSHLGLDLKSLDSAREWLQSHQFVESFRCQPGVFEYCLLVPGTSVRIPPPPKRRGKRLFDATALKSLPVSKKRGRAMPENRLNNSLRSHAANRGRTADLRGLECLKCHGPYTDNGDGTSSCRRCRPLTPLSARDIGF